MDMEFGDYRLREASRELIGPAGPIELSARAFDLLRALLAQPDTVLSKDALFAAAWPGMIVEDNTLQVHMSALRKALGTGYIATVHGRGYKYAGPPPRAAGGAAVSDAASGSKGNIGGYRSDCIERDAEAETITRLLEQHRLVSIVGPGGVGKTTLAIAVAEKRRAPGGVWLIDLASLDDGAFIDSVLVQTLGVAFRPASETLDTVADHLRQADALLLFDNCEHVHDEVAVIIARLLAGVPNLQILTTSQVPLGLPDERVFKLLPFALATDSDEALATSAAFLAHCIEMAGEELSAEDYPIAERLCRRLDGVALALKMAASRAATIGLAAVDRQIEQQLAGLDADWNTALPRHRSLIASLAWSYDLLSGEQQRTLRALGVFNGSFSLDGAVAVAGAAAGADAAELVRRSLVVRDSVNRGRYRLLDSTRRFALQKLVDAGEEAAARDRHADFITALFAEGIELWETTPDATWEATYRPDGDNLRTALAWTKAQPDSGRHVALVAETGRFFVQEQLIAEGLATIEAALLMADAATPEARARLGLALAEVARILASDIKARTALLGAVEWLRPNDNGVRFQQAFALLTWITFFFREREEAVPLLGELRRLVGDMPNGKTKAWTLVAVGLDMWINGDREAGMARCRAGFALHVAMGNHKGLFRSVMNVSEMVHREGDTRLALRLAEEVLPQMYGRTTQLNLANHVSNISAYHFSLGNIEAAGRFHQESAALMPRDGSYWHVCTLQNAAEWLLSRGNATDAALLLGIVDARIEEWPDGRQANEEVQRTRIHNGLRDRLGDEPLARLLEQGRRLDLIDGDQLAAG